MLIEENASKADNYGAADAGRPTQLTHVGALHPQRQCNHQARESALLHAGLYGPDVQVAVKHTAKEPIAVKRLVKLSGHGYSLTVNAINTAFVDVQATIVA